MRGEVDAQVGLFASELERLVQDLWTWSPTRWTAERIAAARGLALDLVGLAESAGAPHPAVAFPEVAPYALADQLAVVGHDLIAAPHAERAAAQALSRLAAARAALTS